MQNDQDFFQDGPQLKNTFAGDRLLQLVLKNYLPDEVLKTIAPDLERFGERVIGELQPLADRAQSNPPQLKNFAPWGRRIDEIQMDPAWDNLKATSAEEGLVAIAYERKQAEFSRVYQFAKLYLFHPSSAFFTCPLAMTDGASRVIELIGDRELREHTFPRLTTRDSKKFWTSGQWMTEKTGGSDVGQSLTIAKSFKGERGHTEHAMSHALSGVKWFSSSTVSEMAMTLGKIREGNNDPKLSLFYVETFKSSGELNNIEVLRLKDKLGTKGLPTAELRLNGIPAKLVGERGHGVRNISPLLNISRMYNSICSLAQIRRPLSLLKDYASRRQVFGKKLESQTLFQHTFAKLGIEFYLSLNLTFYLALLMGKEECKKISESEARVLRLMIPVLKLVTGKQSVHSVSECLEGFGGAGYIEDTGLPLHLRDAQVFPIWEGTTNVLSLDVFRVLSKDKAVINDLSMRLRPFSSDSLGKAALDKLVVLETIFAGSSLPDANARQIAWDFYNAMSAILLLEQSPAKIPLAGLKQKLLLDLTRPYWELASDSAHDYFALL